MAMQPATAMPDTIHEPSAASAVFVTSGAAAVAADAGTATGCGTLFRVPHGSELYQVGVRGGVGGEGSGGGSGGHGGYE